MNPRSTLLPHLIDYSACIYCGWREQNRARRVLPMKCPECGLGPLYHIVIVRRLDKLDDFEDITIEAMISQDVKKGKCWKCGSTLTAKPNGMFCSTCRKNRKRGGF